MVFKVADLFIPYRWTIGLNSLDRFFNRNKELSSKKNTKLHIGNFSKMDELDKKILRQAVYEIVNRIPRGRATSYGAIARASGFPNMSRMVGKIMSECDSSNTEIPAHRVVNSQGVLSAKDAFTDPRGMQALLEAEGVKVANDRIVNWKKVFWNPIDEIELD